MTTWRVTDLPACSGRTRCACGKPIFPGECIGQKHTKDGTTYHCAYCITQELNQLTKLVEKYLNEKEREE